MTNHSDYKAIVELKKIVSVGATSPVLAVLSDGSLVYVKYPNNRCGSIVLVNEFIGYSLAPFLGVTTPDYGVCFLDRVVVDTVDEYFEGLDYNNCGCCFYSKAITKAIPGNVALTAMHRYITNKESEGIILLDCILMNADRHEGNMLIEFDTGTVFTIDFSHLWKDDSDILLSNKNVYQSFYNWFGFSKDKLFSIARNAKERLTEKELKMIKARIPIEWTNTVGYDKINTLFSTLHQRINDIDKICDYILAGGNQNG